MVLFSYLDEDKSTEYVWYQSDNLVQSVAVANNGTVNLKIVFKLGATYIYYNVDPIDYAQLKNAESNGKAFQIFIAKKIDGKPKYDFRRIEDVDINEVSKQMEDMRNRAFKEAEEKQKAVENPVTEQKEVKQETVANTTNTTHKLDIKYDQTGGRMLVFVDGEEVSHYPCQNSNDYARLALFLAPIVSYLGYPLKINVGD